MEFDKRRRADEAAQADRDDMAALESTVSQIKGGKKQPPPNGKAV